MSMHVCMYVRIVQLPLLRPIIPLCALPHESILGISSSHSFAELRPGIVHRVDIC